MIGNMTLLASYNDSWAAFGIAIAYIFVGLGSSLGFGFLGRYLVKKKGYPTSENHGFAWGFLLGVIGVLVCALKKEYNANDQNRYNQNIYGQMGSVSSTADELQKYKKLLDDGAITEAEYEVKKRQLLG